MYEDTIGVTTEGQTIQWQKENRTKGQTMIEKTLHRKLKTEQHEPISKSGVNSGAPEGWAVCTSDFISFSSFFLIG